MSAMILGELRKVLRLYGHSYLWAAPPDRGAPVSPSAFRIAVLDNDRETESG